MDRFVIISGCSGAGKSTLLAELNRRAHHVVEEPGRRIVAEEIDRAGSALPWSDAPAFARRAMAMAHADRAKARAASGLVFFDRGLIDAAAALQDLTSEAVLACLRRSHRYNRNVFMAPPWLEIYRVDDARRHDFAAAVAEFDRLSAVYPALGYDVHLIPKTDVAKRADFVLSTLAHR